MNRTTVALSSVHAEIAFIVDSAACSTVDYSVGIMNATKLREGAENYYSLLRSEEALDVGFTIPS
ncbi:hypothetical protein [Paenibacillus harenae]|uniref:hypothetical protein n=1 Tax=Paenibacillus harenae TaxID=306543 RepID=UPI00040434D4|nr:hypothetical protein [Paenibacillus harenae]